MGYKIIPVTEDPPVFAPVPKPDIPPPGDEPNKEECVYFFYQPIMDPVSGVPIHKPPEKGMHRFGDIFPPGVSQAIPCDDVDPAKVTPRKMCFIPVNAGQGQNSVIFCGSLFVEDLTNLFSMGGARHDYIVSPRILEYLANLAGRLGIATDDPYLLFREYDFYPIDDCADCQVWVVGCISESDDDLFSSHCGTTPALMPASRIVGGKVKSSRILVLLNLMPPPEEKDFTNIQRFEGPGAYARAAAFYQTIGQNDTWKCKDQECYPCCSYCVGIHFASAELCQCSCAEFREPECCPCDCVSRTGSDGEGFSLAYYEYAGCAMCCPPGSFWDGEVCANGDTVFPTDSWEGWSQCDDGSCVPVGTPCPD